MSEKLEHAVLYIRSASNSKKSLESQKIKGQNYAKKHSLQLSIIEDPHASGNGPLENRAGLRWLLHLWKLDLSALLLLSRHAELAAVLLIRVILNGILKNTTQS